MGNDGFAWLGRGADLFGLPNSVSLMILLFVVAHVVMSRTSIGRYVYAVGGNPKPPVYPGFPSSGFWCSSTLFADFWPVWVGSWKHPCMLPEIRNPELWLNCRSSQPLSLGERVWQAGKDIRYFGWCSYHWCYPKWHEPYWRRSSYAKRGLARILIAVMVDQLKGRLK